jgi:hypothetical protein
VSHIRQSVVAVILVAAFASTVSACGGGGASGAADAAQLTVPTSQVQTNIQGNYVATVNVGTSAAQTIYLSVTSNGDAMLVGPGCNLYIAGLTAVGSTLTGTGTEYAPSSCNGVNLNKTFNGAGTTLGFTVQGQASNNSLSINGLMGVSGPTTFSKTTTSGRTVTSANLSGGTFSSSSLGLTVSFDNTGKMTGNFQGTPVIGQVSIPNTSLNQISFQITAGSDTYAGIASLEDSGNASFNTLNIQAHSGNKILSGVVVRNN